MADLQETQALVHRRLVHTGLDSLAISYSAANGPQIEFRGRLVLHNSITHSRHGRCEGQEGSECVTHGVDLVTVPTTTVESECDGRALKRRKRRAMVCELVDADANDEEW